ncbi:MAG: Uma2 family endonuclease [Cyanobacteria bacterium J06632_3]
MSRTLTRWTVEDYHQIIANGVLAGRQVELINGQILDMAPEPPIQRATYRRGAKYLEQLLRDRAVIFSAAPIVLPTDGEPQPDISVLHAPETRYDDRHPTPEDVYWLIEVSNSTLAYDLGEKAKAYALDGIEEYWVVDVKARQLWIHRVPTESGYSSVEIASAGTLSPLKMPDVAVDVERMF